MRHRRIDLNLIVALQALLEHRNVTRAALAMNVTQSTMSGILGRLRESFGDQLLVQVGRHMRLTPLAESLIGPSQNVIEHIDALLDTQPVFDPATARRNIVIATSDYVVTAFLGDLLSAIAEEAPGLRFELAPPVTDWGSEVDAGSIDYVIGPSHVSSLNHPSAVLFEDSYTIVAWSGNCLLGEGSTMPLAQFESLGHVVFHAAGRPWFEQWYFTEYGNSRRIEMLVSGFNQIPPLVVGTNRIATVQTRLAVRAAEYLPLRLLQLPMRVPPLVEVLQWSRHRQSDPVHSWLRGRLQAGAGRLATEDETLAPGAF